MADILILSSSYLEKDPRVLRQIRALKEEHKIYTCGLTRSGMDGITEYPILKVPAKTQPFFTRLRNAVKMFTKQYDKLTWSEDVLQSLKQNDYDVIIVNDPREMGLAVALKELQSAPLRIYFDLHEYFIDVDENPIINRVFADLTDKYYLEADVWTTVNEPIAELYEERYGKRPTVIKNAGSYVDISPKEVSTPIKLVHHGVANRSRRIEVMIEAMRKNTHCTLSLYLVGSDKKYIAELKERAKSMKNVSFNSPVEFSKIIPTLASYDVGVFALDPLIRNYYLALPNKIFEFIQARLAIIVTPNPAMAEIVEQYDNGMVSLDFSVEALSQTISSLTRNGIQRMKYQSHHAASIENETYGIQRTASIVNELLKELKTI